jgi:peptidoglycan hydrolase FlgJ
MVPPTALAADSRSLDRLKNQAAADPVAAGKEAARQFEALFMQSLIKSMRDAMPKSDLFGGEETQTYTAMLDQQLAQTFAGRAGGLAESIARQIERLTSKSTVASAAAAATSTTPSAKSPARTADDANVTATAGQKEFIDKLWQPALAAQRSTGVPAQFIIAQAALETGWGKREIRQTDGSPSHNLFGIKANAAWSGDTASVTTTEYVAGKPQRQRDGFRAYASYADSMQDWASLMARSERYSAVIRDGQTAQGFANGLQNAGYATDPNYAQKLTALINQTVALKRSPNAPI